MVLVTEEGGNYIEDTNNTQFSSIGNNVNNYIDAQIGNMNAILQASVLGNDFVFVPAGSNYVERDLMYNENGVKGSDIYQGNSSTTESVFSEMADEINNFTEADRIDRIFGKDSVRDIREDTEADVVIVIAHSFGSRCCGGASQFGASAPSNDEFTAVIDASSEIIDIDWMHEVLHLAGGDQADGSVRDSQSSPVPDQTYCTQNMGCEGSVILGGSAESDGCSVSMYCNRGNFLSETTKTKMQTNLSVLANTYESWSAGSAGGGGGGGGIPGGEFGSPPSPPQVLAWLDKCQDDDPMFGEVGIWEFGWWVSHDTEVVEPLVNGSSFGFADIYDTFFWPSPAGWPLSVQATAHNQWGESAFSNLIFKMGC